MNGLTRITDRIACDTERDAADLLAHAREDIHEKHQHYQRIAQEKQDQLSAQARILAQEVVDRTVRAAEMDARKTRLTVKQELVSAVFDKALAQLTALPDTEYRAFLIHQAAKAALTGHEEIVLNPSDRQRHGAIIVAGANQILDERGTPAALTLSSETRPMKGGLILKAGPIETNCTCEVLVKLARNTLTSEVARIIFDA